MNTVGGVFAMILVIVLFMKPSKASMSCDPMTQNIKLFYCPFVLHFSFSSILVKKK